MVFVTTELNARYSNIIKSYLDKGYIISPQLAYRGFIGVKSFIDLTNPKEKDMIYRVWVKDDYDYEVYHCFLIKIEVRKYDRKIYKGTLLPHNGDIVDKKSFFTISTENGVYTDDENEIKQINERRSARREMNEFLNKTNTYHIRDVEIEKVSADFIDNIMARINRVRGFKRANATCIQKITLYRNSYYNYRRDKRDYRLEAKISFSFNGNTGNIYLK